jgi:hypothetical protein
MLPLWPGRNGLILRLARFAASSAASIAAQQVVQIPLQQASVHAGTAACTTAACLGLLIRTHRPSL